MSLRNLDSRVRPAWSEMEFEHAINMKLFTHPILAIAALFLIAACSDDPQTVTANGENITGGWFLSCFVDGTDGAAISRDYSGGGLIWYSDGWLEDTTCNGASDYTLSGSTSITFMGTKSVSGLTASKFDWTDTASVMTPNNTDTVNSFAANAAYGISGWASGVGQSVLGVDYSGATQAIAGRDIVYVDTTASPNTLTFGNTAGSLDSSGFPATLETNSFIKQ